MKGNRDYSMLYGVLAGFALFVLFVGWLIAHTDWDSHVGSPVDYLFPEGTQIIEERDSHGGFHGDGVAFLSAQIPPEASQDFALLQVSIFGSASDAAYDRLTAALCEIVNEELGIDLANIYVKYEEVDHWGWNDSNF